MDLLHTIRRIKSNVRWHYYWNFGDGTRLNDNNDDQDDANATVETDDADEVEVSFDFKGFHTFLKAPGVVNCSFLGDGDTEAFLHDLELELLASIRDEEPRDCMPIAEHDDVVDKLLHQLRNETDVVMVATDKTNRHILMRATDYNAILAFHVRKNCILLAREDVGKFYNEATDFLASLSGLISRNEAKYLRASLNGKFIPNPKILIKDHKPTMKKYSEVLNFHDSRFIVPTGNFLSAFSRLGYSCIEQVFKRNGVDFAATTIKNSTELIRDLEFLELNSSNCTIASFDIVSMYPNCKLSYIERALDYFSQDFGDEDKNLIKNGWRVARFGMKRTLIRARENYFLFKGDSAEGGSEVEQGLSIGGYESAFLADLTVGFLFVKMDEVIKRDCYYGKIYRDDSLIVLKEVLTNDEVDTWKEMFCELVTEEMPCMVFTVSKWDNGLDFLDLFFEFDAKGDLTWRTFSKPNAITKYLNSCSPGHTPSCKKAIAPSVINRLARLTKPRPELEDTQVLHYYREHGKALEIANLCLESNPRHGITFGAVWRQDKVSGNSKVPENNEEPDFQVKTRDKRVIHFVHTYSGRFLKGKPIHKIVQETRNKHGLRWLRFRMSTKRFASVEDKFNADLQGKVDAGIISKTFLDFDCNCRQPTMVNGKCMFGGRCREVCVNVAI